MKDSEAITEIKKLFREIAERIDKAEDIAEKHGLDEFYGDIETAKEWIRIYNDSIEVGK